MVVQNNFKIVTVGWSYSLITNLCDRVAEKSGFTFSHLILHGPHWVFENTEHEWPVNEKRSDIYFLREELETPMPSADRKLLASLEEDGVPTIHNMIQSDRIVSKIDYKDALKYATFLAIRLRELYELTKPSVVLGGFDSIHGSMALAVARQMSIPWYVLNYSVIPTGLACFCDAMYPAARIQLHQPDRNELRLIAETHLSNFENKELTAPAYLPPGDKLSISDLGKLPAKLCSAYKTLRKSRFRKYLQFTEKSTAHNLVSALNLLIKNRVSRKALAQTNMRTKVPDTPYVLFGLHFQPEGSIDVWAPYFSNQLWVIELLARSIPPSHKLLVKIHKSDISNYTSAKLRTMQSFPGVELVEPAADARVFIEKSDLVIAIQGTMGLEAAFLGKPVIMLGNSPVKMFPSADSIGPITDLSALIKTKLDEKPPRRDEILDAYMDYLAPFDDASHNNWQLRLSDDEIDNYIKLFNSLSEYCAEQKCL